MDGLVILFIIGAVVLYRMGPKKRADLKRQISKSLNGVMPGSTPTRGRRRPLPSGGPQRAGAPRRSSLPPPRNPQPPPPSSLPPPPEPVEEVLPDPVSAPLEPIVIDIPEPELGPAPIAESAADPEPEPDPETQPAAAPDLSQEATIDTLFFDQRNAQARLDAFENEYAGHSVEWAADVIRTSNSRRHGEARVRAELFLGYASEDQFHSKRVLAEAYFPAGTELERDSTISFRGVLADANVFARRIVLDDAALT